MAILELTVGFMPKREILVMDCENRTACSRGEFLSGSCKCEYAVQQSKYEYNAAQIHRHSQDLMSMLKVNSCFWTEILMVIMVGQVFCA